MTPAEYTRFCGTIRADHPELHQYLPDYLNLLDWQNFVERLLEKLTDFSQQDNIQISELEDKISELEDETEDLKERLEAYENRKA